MHSVTYWKKNNELFDWTIYNRNITKNDQGDLTFPFPHESDAGVYQCFAMNEMGISMSPRLNVRQFEFKKFENTSETVKFAVHLQSLIKINLYISFNRK